MGLKESKDLAERAPATLKQEMPIEDARKLTGSLEALGATVTVK
ncbi:ribosomal protein L7/L12 [Kitasatospora sp. NPDC101155]